MSHTPPHSSSPILFKETIIFQCFLSRSFISNFNIYSKFLFHVMFFTSNANFYRNELRKSKSSYWPSSHFVFLSCDVMSCLNRTWCVPTWRYLWDAIFLLLLFLKTSSLRIPYDVLWSLSPPPSPDPLLLLCPLNLVPFFHFHLSRPVCVACVLLNM